MVTTIIKFLVFRPEEQCIFVVPERAVAFCVLLDYFPVIAISSMRYCECMSNFSLCGRCFKYIYNLYVVNALQFLKIGGAL